MATVRKDALTALREALAASERLVAAAEGEETSCAVFHNAPWGGEWSEEHKRSVRLYVDTWIAAQLRAAIADIDGDRSYSNEAYLRQIADRSWRL